MWSQKDPPGGRDRLSFVLRRTPQKAIVLAIVVLAATLAALRLPGWPAVALVTTSDVLVFSAATLALLLVATVLRDFRYRNGVRLGAIGAQNLFRLICRRLAPPTVAAVLTVGHTGQTGDGIAVFAAMACSTALFGNTRYPVRLGGLARFVFDLLMPMVGILVAFLAAAFWDVSLPAQDLVGPLIGAWFVTFSGGWLEEAFNAERPVRLAVIGAPVLAGTFVREMEAAGVRDHCIVGWISGAAASEPGDDRPPRSSLDLRWLGSVENVRSAVVQHEIDLLVMTRRGASPDLLQEVVERCVDLPVRMVEASFLYEELHGRVPIDALSSAWFAYIMHPNFSARATWTKRVMDMTVAAVLVVLLAPLFVVVAIAVKLGDGGPILFRQRRVGAQGHDFHLLKFRTMVVDAEPLGQARWASQHDERVTQVGRLLRRTHLDEMPQLLNVLAGRMSLVGPRPERPEFVAQLERRIPYYSRRLLAKPGLTGWAQVRSGYASSEMGTAFKLSHDLYYIKHRSFGFDLLTLVETARMLVADVHLNDSTIPERFTLRRADERDAEMREVGEWRSGAGDAHASREERATR
jgi:exopolysaccharide biosynthesis polyprenyl glycosylphosphotransferase